MIKKRRLLLVLALAGLAACAPEMTARPPVARPTAAPTAAPTARPAITPLPLEPTGRPPDDPLALPGKGGSTSGRAYVEEVELLTRESSPVQITAVVRGHFPDGCTTLQSARAVRAGNVFTIELSTHRPQDMMCTDVLVPFQENVPLDVAGLKAGEYQVKAGEAAAHFTLAP